MTTPNKLSAIVHEKETGNVQEQIMKPEWVRPRQVTHFFGIGRTQLYELIAAGKIVSCSLKKRGQRHGTRLISYDSLSAYLESLATEGDL